MQQKTERNLGLDLARATEAAALAAGQWAGRGEMHAADAAATRAMRHVLNTIHMDGTVVMGEEARHPDYPDVLATGEKVGDGKHPAVDVAEFFFLRVEGPATEHQSYKTNDTFSVFQDVSEISFITVPMVNK